MNGFAAKPWGFMGILPTRIKITIDHYKTGEIDINYIPGTFHVDDLISALEKVHFGEAPRKALLRGPGGIKYANPDAIQVLDTFMKKIRVPSTGITLTPMLGRKWVKVNSSIGSVSLPTRKFHSVLMNLKEINKERSH